MTPTVYATQLPRLSKWDPGVTGEGSLDPMGVAAVADRIADLLAPGLRARMSHPRFVTLSALGAVAGMRLNGTVASDRTTTADIAFEWIVVEALVRNARRDNLYGLPGSRKAQRATSEGERLSAANYLRGPRAFGFTGVYRPFSVDAGVLEPDGLPGPAAEKVVSAWEADHQLAGYLADTPGTDGSRFRREISRFLPGSLQRGECASTPTGWVSLMIAATMTPSGARRRERSALRGLVLNQAHETRHVLASLMADNPPAADAGEHQLAAQLTRVASGQVRDLLAAATAYERCATLLTNMFRRVLRHSVTQADGLLRHGDRGRLKFADHAARSLPGLVDQATTTAARIDDALAVDVELVFGDFTLPLAADACVDAVIARHVAVQAAKGKRTWLEEVGEGWYVRPPYGDQHVPEGDEWWINPMRLQTLAQFLAATR